MLHRLRKHPFAILLASLGIVSAGLLVAALLRERPFTPRAELQVEPRSIRPDALRPVPADLDPLYREIGDLQERGEFREAASRYHDLLVMLAGRWGSGSPDLAPYYYNFCYALGRAGERERSESVLFEARRKWPGDLQLAVLDLRARTAAALGRQRMDPELDALYRQVLASGGHARLRGLGIAPESLFVEWAEALLASGELPCALDAVESALRLDPAGSRARNAKARVLLAMGRRSEAFELIEGLGTADRTPDVRFFLGKSFLDEGRMEEALGVLFPLLEEVESAPGELDARALGELRIATAEALIGRGRFRRAAEALVRGLIGRPADRNALRTLAHAVRGLGRTETALRLEGRAGELAALEDAARSSLAARLEGRESVALYFDARADRVLDRTGFALAKLAAALEKSLASVACHREYGRLLERLGLHARAASLFEDALEATGSPLFLLELARVRARQEKPEEARALLADPRLAAAFRVTEDHAAELAVLAGERLRVELTLGEIDAAEQWLRANPPGAGADAPALRLARAEIALARGRLREVDALLSDGVDGDPEDVSWRRALRFLAGLTGPGTRKLETILDGFDPSDLLDRPRLFRSTAYLRERRREAPAVAAWLARLEATARRGEELRLRLDRGDPDADEDAWRELLALYREGGARRKAREVAWYLLGRAPGDADRYAALAAVLARPEEVVERLAVVEDGLRLDPAHPELVRAREDARRALGLAAQEGNGTQSLRRASR